MSLTLRATFWNNSTISGVSALTRNRPLATSASATYGEKFASARAFSSALRGVLCCPGCAPGGWVIAKSPRDRRGLQNASSATTTNNRFEILDLLGAGRGVGVNCGDLEGGRQDGRLPV